MLPSITIAICTRNRSFLLLRTLQALREQTSLTSNTQTLVVDNQSTDGTSEVVREYEEVLCCVEPDLGIANARNRAAAEAKGDWLIYLDDDAIPADGWLAHMIDCIEHLTPQPRCIIGKVDLQWENSRAAWFPERYESLLSRYDLGDEGHYVSAGGYLLTTNAAFDRQHLLDLGGFRTDLGHRGNSLLGGEDNDMFNRLIASHSLIWYEPRALVRHWVPLERQRFAWLVKRVFWDGATQPLLDYGSGLPRDRYLREMVRDIRRTGRIVISHFRDLRTSAGWRDTYLEIWRQIGRFYMNWSLFRQ